MGIIFVALEIVVLFAHFYFFYKEEFNKLIYFTLVFFVLSIPNFIILLYFRYAENNHIINYFSWCLNFNKYPLLTINDWFNPILGNLHTNNIQIYLNYFKSPLKLFYSLLLSISSVCFLYGFSISLKDISRKFIYLFLIALFFLSFEFIWWFYGNFTILTRYTLIIAPIILLICTNGILLIKNNNVKFLLIGLIFIIYSINIYNYKSAITFSNRADGYKYPANIINKLGLKGSYILALEGSEYYKKYLNNYNFIYLNIHKMLHMDNTKKETLKIFNKNFVKNTNFKNAHENFKPYLTNTKPTTELTAYINSQINKIPKGNLLIYINGPYHGGIWNYNEINRITKNQEEYNDKLFLLIAEKIDLDIKNILENSLNLTKTKTVNFNSSHYYYQALIYKKTKG